jgi:hypothetical protein
MTKSFQSRRWRILVIVFLAGMCMAAGEATRAANHLDTPTVIADPRADIGDIFAWTSPDGRRLNLVMAIVGHTFSDKLSYVFHIDSGARFGETTATTSIVCRFSAMNAVDCRAGDVDRAVGDASGLGGLDGGKHRFRVFAGLRDDPFFNNVKGSRDAYRVASAALKAGAAVDAARCPAFSAQTSQAILNEWRHTEGGPAKNFLAGWTPAALVISIDLDAVSKGGKMLAVWAVTATPEKQLDRMGRPLTANALLGTLDPGEVSDELKEQYNLVTPATSQRFVPEIEKGLGLYDGFDGVCGNQLLADRSAQPGLRYRRLAELLADDRLWINSDAAVCTQFFAVELANLAGQTALSEDCGGRTPNHDAIDVYRSLLANGTTTGIDDGVDHDEREHSVAVFPFLAAPDASSDAGAASNY